MPDRADAQLARWLSSFERHHVPIDVSFRDLLQNPGARDREQHDLHGYPARLLLNIPRFFLTTTLSRAGELILDPFCGSGTVLVEGVIAGRNVAGADLNPLARLITRVKVTAIPRRELLDARRRLFERLAKNTSAQREYPAVINLDYWFYPHVRRDLLRLREAIDAIRSQSIRDFYLLALSACIKDLSLADPRLSVPVRLRPDQYKKKHWLHAKTAARLKWLRVVKVLDVFRERLDENIDRLAKLHGTSSATLRGLDDDSRALSSLDASDVALAITSPPYPGAQKYIRASGLSLTWLEMCAADQLRALEEQNIGREHFRKSSHISFQKSGVDSADDLLEQVWTVDPLRAHIISTYLIEMRASFVELKRVVKPGGHLVVIVGPSTVCGRPLNTPDYLSDLAEETGFSLRLHLVDTIRARSLMTKRHASAGRIDTESILLFRRAP